MNTARLLGRTTASVGAPEEISIGAGLSLSAGTLVATGGSGAYTTTTWASSITIDPAGLNGTKIALSGTPTTINVSAGADGQRLMLELTQSGAGNRLVTWGANIAFGTDITSVTLSTTINQVDYVALTYSTAATKWRVIAFARGY